MSDTMFMTRRREKTSERLKLYNEKHRNSNRGLLGFEAL